MSHSIFFDKKAFNKGVNDTFTLRPIRNAVSSAVKEAKTTISGKSAGDRREHGRGSDERRNTPTRKAG